MRSRAIGAWRISFLERYLLSKFIVATLASAFALTAISSVFAAADPALSSAPTAQSSAVSSASAAQSPTPSPAPSTAAKVAKKPSPSDIICKPDSGTGTRIGGAKICMSRADWKQRED